MLMDKELYYWLKQIKGGALEPQDVERALEYVRDLGGGLKIVRTYAQGVTIFGSARIKEGDALYKKARELGKLLATNGHAVITGGGPGIMEAANRGAFEYGGRSIGLNITLEHEQHPNPYLTDTFKFKYFFARKVMLVMSAKVYVFFPGGFGTLDELSEVLILMQENKMPDMPIFLIGKNYWRPLIRLFQNRMLKNKLISAGDLKLFKVTDDINDVVKAANKIGHPKLRTNIYDDFDRI